MEEPTYTFEQIEKEIYIRRVEETINKLGLRLSDEPINAQIAPKARVFEYPHLDKVFVMESDLYGNTMPKGSCFLAFYGHHGFIGKHLKVETLKNASLQDMKALVERNIDGWRAKAGANNIGRKRTLAKADIYLY